MRDMTADGGRSLLRDGIATCNSRTGERKIDLDGDDPIGSRTVATLDCGGRIGFDDTLLF
jgi:hypothetical protein